jgi:hypothetical protein
MIIDINKEIFTCSQCSCFIDKRSAIERYGKRFIFGKKYLFFEGEKLLCQSCYLHEFVIQKYFKGFIKNDKRRANSRRCTNS